MTDPAKTPLDALHRGLGGRMVDVRRLRAAGAVPDRHPEGAPAHARRRRPVRRQPHGPDRRSAPVRATSRDAAAALERLVPVDIARPRRGPPALRAVHRRARRHPRRPDGGQPRRPSAARRQRRAQGGRPRASASRARRAGCSVEPLDRALLALQGPKAEAALATLLPEVASMRFMDVRELETAGVRAIVSRSGYTGEDGFEISLDPAEARRTSPSGCCGIRTCCRSGSAPAIRCGSRPGSASTATTSTRRRRRSKRRSNGRSSRPGGRAAPAPGAFPATRSSSARSPRARRGAASGCGRRAARRCARGSSWWRPRPAIAVGKITSGGFGPSLDAPVAMGYVPIGLAAPGTRLYGRLRGKDAACDSGENALHCPRATKPS